jgi:YD repeat-containing protein
MIITAIRVTKGKQDYHLSFSPSGGVLLGAFQVGSDSRYKYTASSRRLEIHSKIISVKDQDYTLQLIIMSGHASKNSGIGHPIGSGLICFQGAA